MWNRYVKFISSNLYLIGGTLVVGALTLTTGAFTMSVVGYSLSYGIVSIIEKIIQ